MNTASGKNGKIDSIDIKTHAKMGPNTPIEFIKLTIVSLIFSIHTYYTPTNGLVQ